MAPLTIVVAGARRACQAVGELVAGANSSVVASGTATCGGLSG
jgi:hypothetical protein